MKTPDDNHHEPPISPSLHADVLLWEVRAPADVLALHYDAVATRLSHAADNASDSGERCVLLAIAVVHRKQAATHALEALATLRRGREVQ